VLKFLGSGHTQKSALSLQPSWIDFRRGTYQEFFDARVEIAYAFTAWFPCIRITVRVTEIYIKTACVNSPHFLVIFQTKNLEFAILKYFWLRLEICIVSITYFSYTKWMRRILELLLRSSTNLSERVIISLLTRLLRVPQWHFRLSAVVVRHIGTSSLLA